MYKISEDSLGGTNFRLTAFKHEYIEGGVLESIVGQIEYTLFVFDRHTAVIADLEIPEKHRRQGIATELLEEAVKRIFSRPWMKNIMLQDGSEGKVTGRMAKKLGFEKLDKPGSFWRLSKKRR